MLRRQSLNTSSLNIPTLSPTVFVTSICARPISLGVPVRTWARTGDSAQKAASSPDPSRERVGDFLTGSFHLFQTLSGENGYLPDDNRLVQQWFWYSVYDPDVYPTGNLIDHADRQLSPLGEIWVDYINGSSLDSSLIP